MHEKKLRSNTVLMVLAQTVPFAKVDLLELCENTKTSTIMSDTIRAFNVFLHQLMIFLQAGISKAKAS